MNVTPVELLRQIDAGTAPAMLDVRSRAEFLRGHVPGAVHIPFWKIRESTPTIRAARQDPVVVYCGHGPRAWMAGAALRRQGFTQVIYLAGHMFGWRRAGLREEAGG